MRWSITSEDGERGVNIWKCDKCGKIVKDLVAPNGWMLVRQINGIEMDICIECAPKVINCVLSLIADVKLGDD